MRNRNENLNENGTGEKTMKITIEKTAVKRLRNIMVDGAKVGEIIRLTFGGYFMVMIKGIPNKQVRGGEAAMKAAVARLIENN